MSMEAMTNTSETLTNLIMKINELSDSLCKRAESIQGYMMGGRNPESQTTDNKPECLIDDIKTLSSKLNYVDILLRQIQDGIG